ncbi:CPBP family intramembrane glutamic endopeptidase [Herpetosiphon giganteus]|uniref:CPBP family intramembrane glutamic endopeptidase n=1 Tax=Herpetosiphon giganteus TaxID=2029754 RepID=UPI00195E6E50|nr:CPBP family intramembrane glutamic endopeptidase [Herpetosiphon giganteus]MBM7845502.1 membrane protease YdiL (CAAX protease family) [Herpetosiphon giganteus]
MRRWWLWLELLVLFGCVPLVLRFAVSASWWFGVLGLAALGAWVWLRRRGVPIGLWQGRLNPCEKHTLWRLLRRFGLASLLTVLLVWLWQPDHLFNLLRQQPWVWLLLVLAYPIVSVYIQELVFRGLFFARYHTLLNERWLLLLNAVVFGWAHIIFRNPYAVILTIIGGWLFGDTYRQTRSLRLVCLEHALYGNLMFTVGLGHYFFSRGLG